MTNEEILAEAKTVQLQIDALQAKQEAVLTQLVCEVCGGKDKVGIRLIMCAEPICRHCFELWYDSGIMDPALMRSESLKRQGVAANG